MARTIQSPGTEIREIDNAPTPTFPVGTNVLVAGFAPKGPTDEVLTVTSLSEFQEIFGTPVSPAERYFAHTVEPLFNSTATVKLYRMPYGANNGAGFGSNYGALVYPVTAVDISQDPNRSFGNGLSTFNQYTSGVMYFVGKPYHYELNETQYQSYITSQTWSTSFSSGFTTVNDLGRAGIVVINSSQTTIDNTFDGYYIGVADNTTLTPATPYNAVLSVKTITQSAVSTGNYLTLPETRLNFPLSSSQDSVLNAQAGTSVSQVIEDMAGFDLNNRSFDDTLSLGLFKLRQSIFSPDTIKLDYTLAERHVGSVDYYREINSQNGGSAVSFFIETADGTSPNIQIYVNPYMSHKNGTTWLSNAGVPSNKIRTITTAYANPLSLLTTFSGAFGCTSPSDIVKMSSAMQGVYNALGAVDNLYAVGAYQSTDTETKDLGSIPTKLDRLFDIVEDTDLYPIDITVDGGLSTIFAVSEWLEVNAPQNVAYFNDNVNVTAIAGLAQTDPTSLPSDAATFRDNWSTIYSKFASFAQFRRKDHLFIADLPRHIFVQGANTLTLSDPDKSFSLNIFNPIKNILVTANTSYAATYANWAKVFDNYLDDQCWVPFSGTIAATMANTDSNFQPWYASAGFTRGVVTGVNDIALYPKQKQRDQLYKISTNPITLFPNEGIVIYGQKTLLKKPSAFDRINVRRLFLNLEKATDATVRYFVFEPNTLLTRTRVLNELRPIFENAKNTEGLYDYLIVCDERNNTPAVIDANELVVDIYLKPVRTAEFILVNFHAERTGTSFNELIG